MIYKVILFVMISCISGIKRPLYGGLAGFITAPLLSVISSPFDLPTVIVLAAFGFGFGLICGRVSWWLFRGSDDKQHQSRPYVMPITRAGGGQRGEIVYTDEEEKNVEENKNPIR